MNLIVGCVDLHMLKWDRKTCLVDYLQAVSNLKILITFDGRLIKLELGRKSLIQKFQVEKKIP